MHLVVFVVGLLIGSLSLKTRPDLSLIYHLSSKAKAAYQELLDAMRLVSLDSGRERLTQGSVGALLSRDRREVAETMEGLVLQVEDCTIAKNAKGLDHCRLVAARCLWRSQCALS